MPDKKIVYGVYFGDSWDGLNLEGLFFKKETARVEALKLVEIKQKVHERLRAVEDIHDDAHDYEDDDTLWPDWVEEEENKWVAGGYEIEIRALVIT